MNRRIGGAAIPEETFRPSIASQTKNISPNTVSIVRRLVPEIAAQQP
jgi:hypothetical protein